MPQAADLKPDYGRFMGLMCGPRHSGKTVAECSFPKPILNLDFDMRIKGLLGAKWIDRKGIEYETFPPRIGKKYEGVDPKTGKPYVALFQQLNERLDILSIDISNGKGPQTLIIDSLTSLTFGLICDALPLTHATGNTEEKKRGRFIGSMRVPGPDDYNYESIGIQQILAYLRSLPIPNILVSVHVVPTFGKEDPENPMSNTIEIGETFALRPKISATAPIYFDHIIRFDRQWDGNKESFSCEFRSDVANTSWHELPNKMDVTNKSFYDEMLKHVHREPFVAGK